MKLPVITGIIERRILVNFRMDKDVITDYLPEPFEPVLHEGYGICGICLIKFKDMRPKGMPTGLGISSENGAHRFAVKWMEDGIEKEGVYIARRDSSSKLNSLLGGRVFPGVLNYSEIESSSEDGNYKVTISNKDGLYLHVDADESGELPSESIFPNIDSVSKFFEKGSVGYSPKRSIDEYEGMQLKTYKWDISPMKVNKVKSTFFQNGETFPAGSVVFDNALLMKNIEHEWHTEEDISATHSSL
jgi:hypothetical protein